MDGWRLRGCIVVVVTAVASWLVVNASAQPPAGKGGQKPPDLGETKIVEPRTTPATPPDPATRLPEAPPQFPAPQVPSQPPATPPEPTTPETASQPPTPQTPTQPAAGSLGLGSNLIGQTGSAGSGYVNQSDLQLRVMVRPGEILETIPGLIASPHSGSGKAAQFNVRGVYMDHGTDFSLYVEGQPLNSPSHAHGQGYLDYNWIIPELVQSIYYRKGPYWADVGDFSSTGTAALRIADRLEQGFAKIEAGMYGFTRIVAADSMDVGQGHLLYGFETRYVDTAFEVPERAKKFVGVLKYTLGDAQCGMNLCYVGYEQTWFSTNQQPELAMDRGLIDRFGNLSPTDGGSTYRHGLTSESWLKLSDNSITRANGYLTYQHLNLYSNFEFFRADGSSAQIQQEEYRRTMGGGVSHRFDWELPNETKMTHTFGVQARNDFLPVLRLANTDNRQFVSNVTSGEVDQTNLGFYYINDWKLCDKFKTMAAVRWDDYWFNVSDHLQAANTGSFHSGIISPKAGMVLGPWEKTEFYANLGYDFHSNDARGVLERIDPAGNPVRGSPALVKSMGYEVGVRNDGLIPGLKTTLALFYLELGSELIFSGDAGTLVPKGATRRYGLELTNNYSITDWWTIDGEFTAVHSRFVDLDPDGGFFVPLSIPFTLSGGTQLKAPCGLFSSLRFRAYSPQPLISDNSFRSENTIVFNGLLGYTRDRFTLALEGINLFNARAPDVSYAYPFRLTPGGAEEISRIVRPTDPIQFRVYVTYTF